MLDPKRSDKKDQPQQPESATPKADPPTDKFRKQEVPPAQQREVKGGTTIIEDIMDV